MLAAVILITWPATTAIRLVVLLAGAFALLPWALGRLRRAQGSPWWAWSPLALGAALLVWSLISAVGSGAPWALSLYGWFGRDNGILMLLGVLALLATGTTLRKGEVASTLWWVVGAASVAALVSCAQALGLGIFGNPLGYQGSNSLLGNPNFAAAFFAITTLISAGIATSSESTRSRALAGLAAALQVVAMLLATSQQGPLALATGLAAGLVLLGLSCERELVRRLTAGIAILAVASTAAVVGAGFAGSGPVAPLLRSDTPAIRVEYWKASLATMLGVPVFGTGPDGLGRYIAEFRPKTYVDLLGPSTRVEAAHNVPLQFGATLGIVGLVLWLALALSVTALLVWAAWTWSRRSESGAPWLIMTVGAAWSAYLAQAMVSIDMVVLLSLGWTLAGMAVALARAPAGPLVATSAKSRVTSAAPTRSTGSSSVLVSASVALALLGAAIGIPGLLAERSPSIRSVDEAQTALASSMTPCSTRLTILNALAAQLDVSTYQALAQTALDTDPRCPPLASLAADAARQAGDLEAANTLSLLATELDPLDYQAWLIRAQILAASGDVTGATTAYDEAVRVAFPFVGSNTAFLEEVAAEIGVPAP